MARLIDVDYTRGGRKKTRQGNGRGTKSNTRVGSKRFKKKYRGQGRWIKK